MKRIIYLISSILVIVSCGPSRHAVHLEMRHPSKSGIELGGKIVSVVYSEGADQRTNLISKNVADAFAVSLQENYGDSVGVYALKTGYGDYAVRDSLFNLLIRTGADLVFLLESQTSAGTSALTPVRVELFCYDGMDSEDKVRKFHGNALLPSSTDEELAKEALKAGKNISESFVPQWKHEQFSIAYYDSERWYDALYKAEQYDWKGAMDIWIGLLDTNDPMKRACAEYNMAVACYLLGDMELARKWLDRSDADNKMPTLSDGLRKRLELKK